MLGVWVDCSIFRENIKTALQFWMSHASSSILKEKKALVTKRVLYFPHTFLVTFEFECTNLNVCQMNAI